MNAEQKAKVLLLAETIAANQEHFDMAHWYTRKFPDGYGDTVTLDGYAVVNIRECGTTACIAGWAVLMFRELQGSQLGYEVTDALGIPGWVPYLADWPKHYKQLADEVGEALAASALLKDIVNEIVVVQPDERHYGRYIW